MSTINYIGINTISVNDSIAFLPQGFSECSIINTGDADAILTQNGQSWTLPAGNVYQLSSTFSTNAWMAISINAVGTTVTATYVGADAVAVPDALAIITDQSSLKEVNIRVDYIAMDILLDWGDNNSEIPVSATESTHNYSATGIYNIALKSLLPQNIYYVNCASANITSLNITKLTNLTNLYCEDNNIQELDLSNNTILQTLWCDNNGFSSATHDSILIALDNNGVLNGLLVIGDGNDARTIASNTAYNSLIAKGWIISDVPTSVELGTWHKGVTDNTLAESIENLPAKFLPRVAKFNGEDDEVLVTRTFTGTELTYYAIINPVSYDFSANHIICGNSYVNRFVLSSGGRLQFYATPASLSLIVSDLFCNLNEYNIISLRIRNNGSDLDVRFGLNGVYEDAVLIGYNLNTFTSIKIGKWDADNYGVTGQIKAIAVRYDYLTDLEIENITPDYVLTGQGGYEYDLVNNNHGTWSGTGDRYTYDLEGSLWAAQNGYSLWEHATLPQIQVPYDVNGNPLSFNYLQCDTAGTAYIDNSVAYGLVFDGIVNKFGGNNISYYSFISNGVNETNQNYGYQIFISAVESLYIRRTGSALNLIATAVGYISINTDYRILVWRNETLDQYTIGAIGTFIAYIQGKTKPVTTTNYLVPDIDYMELIDVSGGVGTNPATDNTYTTSNYFVADLDAGDNIRNLRINNILVSTPIFIISTGAYSNEGIPADYEWKRNIASGSGWNMADSLVDVEAEAPILQCDTAGIAYIESNAAYGEWEFNWLHGSSDSTGSSRVQFISSTNQPYPNTDSYGIDWGAGGKIRLFRITTTGNFIELATSNSSYIAQNTLYGLKITRSNIGTFTIYIKGDSFGESYMLVDVSGGAGSNPVTDTTYTTSNYILTNFDAGDQVSKIKINNKYISPYQFTVDSGAYSITDNAANEIFNRLNTTRQTAESRVSDFYDATHPYRYHVSEIADPRIYDTFFEAASKDKIFGKVTLDGVDIIGWSEELNYGDQKVGDELLTVEEYCGIDSIYP